MNYKFTRHWFKWLLNKEIVSEFDSSCFPFELKAHVRGR